MTNIYPVFDGHNDTIYYAKETGKDFATCQDLDCQISLPHLVNGGVKAAFWAVFVEPGLGQQVAYRKTMEWIGAYEQLFKEYQDNIVMVTKASQIEEVNIDGKIAVILHIEGFDALDNDLKVLEEVYQRGVRSIGLTWSDENQIGFGCNCDGMKKLKPLGKDLVVAMNELGMIVDVSHLNEGGFWEVLEESTSPVIETHGNAYTICSNNRNLKDDQIRAIADQGGTIGVFLSKKFLSKKQDQDMSIVIDHINHIREVGGVDTVAIGSDYGGILSGTPVGMENSSTLQNLISELEKIPYTEEEINKVSFGNLYRVIKEVL